MACGVMWEAMVLLLMRCRFVQRRRASMLERRPMMMGIIAMRSLALLGRMRLLWRVVDIVVWSYTVVARQRASDTWGPPERTALAGRRALNGENWLELSPAGLRRKRLRCGALNMGCPVPLRSLLKTPVCSRCNVPNGGTEHMGLSTMLFQKGRGRCKVGMKCCREERDVWVIS